jgi:GGDEF domain-containing protein
MGVLLSSIGAAMYSSVVIMEVRGALPFAPDGPMWLQSRRPDALEGFLQAFMVTVLLMFGTAIVATLVRKINQRETQLVVANERLAELSRQDPLTKLWNRRHILSHIEQGLAWLNRGRPMAIVMIDLDQFKRVNDNHGHLEGDQMLQIREVGMKFDPANPVTASAGLSIARPGDTVEVVLKRADDSAYSAKGKGGNRLCG